MQERKMGDGMRNEAFVQGCGICKGGGRYATQGKSANVSPHGSK